MNIECPNGCGLVLRVLKSEVKRGQYISEAYCDKCQRKYRVKLYRFEEIKTLQQALNDNHEAWIDLLKACGAVKAYDWIARKIKSWTKKKEPEGGMVEGKGPFIHMEFTIPKKVEFFYKALREASSEAAMKVIAEKILRTELNRYFNSEAYLRARYGVEVKKVRKTRKRKTRKKTRQK